MKQRYRNKLAQYRDIMESGWPLAKLDFSEEAARAMYEYESRGGAQPDESNGYLHGKRWVDWQTTQWRDEMVAGRLDAVELTSDPSLKLYEREVKSAIVAAKKISPGTNQTKIWDGFVVQTQSA